MLFAVCTVFKLESKFLKNEIGVKKIIKLKILNYKSELGIKIEVKRELENKHWKLKKEDYIHIEIGTKIKLNLKLKSEVGNEN